LTLGYEVAYDRVAAFARQWKVDQLARVNSASKGNNVSKTALKMVFKSEIEMAAMYVEEHYRLVL
jgi:hypothetical protein